jgi:two-component system sensor histidine kinase TrcS
MSLRDEAMRLTDSKVSDSLAAFSYSYIKRDAAGVATGELTAFQGQALGTVIAVLRGDSVVYATVFGDGEPKAAPADAQRALEASTCATAECGP